MNAAQQSVLDETAVNEELVASLNERALELAKRRRRSGAVRRRGWLVRRMLLLADVVGLTVAFGLTQALIERSEALAVSDLVPFVLSIPGWVLAAKLIGLYDHDEERTDHSTADDIAGVFQMVTVGTWLFVVWIWLAKAAQPNVPKLITFWGLAILLVSLARVGARTFCRRRLSYIQNAIIVGADDVGQLVARKLLQHPEYGINLVGLVDREPHELRRDLKHVSILGPPERLPSLIRLLDVERVILAFSEESRDEAVALCRTIADMNVQIDIVPRVYELVGPTTTVHAVEGIPLLGLPPPRIARSSMMIKRAVDITVAAIALLLLSPLFAFIAWKIKRDSEGPVFFRQTRLGMNMREFTLLKFRTMKVDTDQAAHRDFIKTVTTAAATLDKGGVYKLDRQDAITSFGHWLRKTSLDELPQLINVLRGDMSLVGPRPCIPYEVENFAPHQLDRFLVPAGLTGLWQVTARAHSTFGEALDMDVAYVRSWSLGLDLRLLLRTPLQVLRPHSTA